MSKIILLFGFFASIQALAGLGDRISQQDQEKNAAVASTVSATDSASSSSSSNNLYTVQDLSVQGQTIKEYINADGVVFAVTWRGVKKPDLANLLGSYFSEYKIENSKRLKAKGRQPLSIKSSRIVVHKSGHMRDLSGRAFVTELIPSGVDVEALP